MIITKFNLNHDIKVRIKDEGIEHYVKKHNELMPFKMHTSFEEYKRKADKEGYHTMQMHEFIDYFGCMGFRLAKLVDLNIFIFVQELLTPTKCSKCGASGLSSGKPFCTDDFCNG